MIHLYKSIRGYTNILITNFVKPPDIYSYCILYVEICESTLDSMTNALE